MKICKIGFISQYTGNKFVNGWRYNENVIHIKNEDVGQIIGMVGKKVETIQTHSFFELNFTEKEL